MDGPSIVQKAGDWTPPAGANQPIHAISRSLVMPGPTEVQFLEYRREVVGSWPESGRKRAALEAIFFRLNGFAGILDT